MATKPLLTPDQLSSYIAINADGTISAYFGKMDMGQGLSVAIRQMVAEELDVPFASMKISIGDTDTSVNQGGASGSTGMQDGGKQMRMAAAEARRVLVEMAADKLGVPAGQLTVKDGVVHPKTTRRRRSATRNLSAASIFNVHLDWNGKYGNPLYAPGKAKPKAQGPHDRRQTYSARRHRAEGFCAGRFRHGRQSPRHGARPHDPARHRRRRAGKGRRKLDQGHPFGQGRVGQGFPRRRRRKEWDAIKAARLLKVEWSNAARRSRSGGTLYDHIRKAPTRKREVGKQAGNVDDAFKTAARVIEAEYEWPFQSHARMGPGCALVEIKDGHVTCWTGTQKAHFVQTGLANILQMPQENVHVIWTTGPGSYGRSDADDCAADAAILAKAVGKPVRLQYMRDQGTGWDPKAPASIHRVRAALDASGNCHCLRFLSKGFSRIDVDTNGSQPKDTLAGQTLGVALQSATASACPEHSYGFANKRTAWETIAPLLDRASPLRSAHMRDPVGPQIHFASESFIDELAAALKVDPVEFRLRYVRDPRDIAVIKAAAEKAGWQSRPSPRNDRTGDKVTGRGIAYAQRGPTRVAVIAEVDVDRSTGKIWARKFTVAHDCGQIINPNGLHHAIENNVVQATSRTLWEEVKFDKATVTSVDWRTYPILEVTEAPEEVDIVMIDHPEIAPSGAGEAASRPVPAAIANAVFDATGVRIRRAPFTPDNVKSALS